MGLEDQMVLKNSMVPAEDQEIKWMFQAALVIPKREQTGGPP